MNREYICSGELAEGRQVGPEHGMARLQRIDRSERKNRRFLFDIGASREESQVERDSRCSAAAAAAAVVVVVAAAGSSRRLSLTSREVNVYPQEVNVYRQSYDSGARRDLRRREVADGARFWDNVAFLARSGRRKAKGKPHDALPH
jgi:hypothetical protein